MSHLDTLNSEGSLSQSGGSFIPLFKVDSTIVKRYRVKELIGRGGFGEVYRAFDLVLSREVAIKVLYRKQSTADDLHEQNVSRFLNEARITAQLKHESLPVTYDFGQLQGGEFYLVCELLNGDSLAARLKSSPLSPAEALIMLSQVSSAVHVAHQRGILHRDLKPSNIFCALQDDSEKISYKVLDFGIAKEIEDQGLSGIASDHTQINGVVGSPRYLSPERLRRETNYGPPSDVYSLGIVLFIALTQQFPYNGKSIMDIGLQHLTAPIPMLEIPGLRQDQLDALQSLINDLLAKAVEDRIQSAEEVAERANSLIALFGNSTSDIERAKFEPELRVPITIPIQRSSAQERLEPNLQELSIQDEDDFRRVQKKPLQKSKIAVKAFAVIAFILMGSLIYFSMGEDDEGVKDSQQIPISLKEKTEVVSLKNDDASKVQIELTQEVQAPNEGQVKPKKANVKSQTKVVKESSPRAGAEQPKSKIKQPKIKNSTSPTATKEASLKTKPKLEDPSSVSLKLAPLKASYVVGGEIKLNLSASDGRSGPVELTVLPSSAGSIKGSKLRLRSAGKVIVRGCIGAVCDQKKLMVFDQPIDEF